VGPGDVTGLARLLLKDGCTAVHLIDRFRYDVEQKTPGIVRHNCSAERFFLGNKGFDFILSCAVMEHVYDPLGAVRAMARALNPDGLMAHAVDCRDHGWFSDSFHDLSFLRIPSLLYTSLRMGGGLNRVRLSDYRRTLEEIGMECRILVAGLSGVEKDFRPALPFDEIPQSYLRQSRANVADIRQSLTRQFRSLPDEDLMVSVFVVTARRPGRGC
jgi:SAM-dependent methyltransferase